MRPKKSELAIFLVGMLIVNVAYAVSAHRLAYSERLGVEYLAMSDKSGDWCRSEILMEVKGESVGFSKSDQFSSLTSRVGEIIASDCPTAKSAQISVFEAGSSEPVWVGVARASEGWLPAAGSPSSSVNLDVCSVRDLDCQPDAQPKEVASEQTATSAHRVGSIGELLKGIESQKSQSAPSIAPEPVVVKLPPGFPRNSSPRIAGPSFVGQDLSRQNFAGKKFDGADFSDADLSGADFSSASMKQSVFKGANLANASFRGTNFTEADFRDAIFPLYLGFSSAVFVGAHFEGADLKGTDFWQSNLTGADLRNTKNFGQVGAANLSKTDLRGANFLNAVGDLSKLKIKGAIYDDTTAFPSGVNPEKLGAIRVQGPKPKVEDFSGQDLSSSDLAYQLLDGANFSGATLRSTRLDGSLLRGANFQDADLRNTYLGRAVLTGADLRGAALPFNLGQQGIDLRDANLEGVDLKGSNFFRSNLSGANLKDTKNFGDLFGVNLSGADLRGANLLTARTGFDFNGAAVNFKGAKYDDDTVFPKGFRPEAAGMVKDQ